MSRLRQLGGTVALSAAIVVVTGGTASSQEVPPIDQATLDSITPPPGTELTDEQAEQIFVTLEGTQAGATSDDSSLTGPCGGVAFSYDGDDQLIDAAYDAGDDAPPVDLIDGGQAFTDDNRFKVDTAGSVSYFGFAPWSGDGPMNYTYTLEVAGVEVASATEENSNGNNRNGGTIDVGGEVPFGFDAKVDAAGDIKIDGAVYCAGEGKVEFVGNGLLSIPGGIGILVLGTGLIGVFVNARPARTWRG